MSDLAIAVIIAAVIIIAQSIGILFLADKLAKMNTMSGTKQKRPPEMTAEQLDKQQRELRQYQNFFKYTGDEQRTQNNRG